MNKIISFTVLILSLSGTFSYASAKTSEDGIPGARVAVYNRHPKDQEDLQQLEKICFLLKSHLVDFSLVEDGDFGSRISAGPGCLEAENGQKFYTLIVPSTDTIPAQTWSVMDEFSEFGGSLLFWGRKPGTLSGTGADTCEDFPGCPRSGHETLTEWTKTVYTSMPESEISILNRIPASSLDYSRTICSDADLFTLENTSDISLKLSASFDAAGKVFVIGDDGSETMIPSGMEDDRARAELTLEPGCKLSVAVRPSTEEFNVMDFGATGRGSTKDTWAIQAAADAAYANGGGTVVVPAGTYLPGALFFRNGVNLEIRKGATIVSTVDSDDFPQIPTRFEGTEKYWRCALLNFDNSRNVRVWGEGTILGRGQEWSKSTNKDGLWGRPRMICFTNCPGGSIRGLTMRDHASWCLHILYTDGFTIDDLNISVSSYVPSSDGVDIDSSSNILMTEVYTNVTDDCLSIKSGKNEDGRRVGRPSMNITVRDCNFDGGHGVAMGSEISGCIRNVLIEDCTCGEENRAPVRFKSQPSRGGLVENITFKDMKLKGCGTFIDANMVWRMVEDYEAFSPRTMLRNIKVIDVTGTAKSVGNIIGDPAAPIPEGTFTFIDCRIKADKGLKLSNVDQRDFSGLDMILPEGEEQFDIVSGNTGRQSAGRQKRK